MNAFNARPEPLGASVEQVAEWLSVQEGRVVTVAEVRVIEFKALRKLRAEFRRRGLGAQDLAPDRP